jgi:hypothetical protein
VKTGDKGLCAKHHQYPSRINMMQGLNFFHAGPKLQLASRATPAICSARRQEKRREAIRKQARCQQASLLNKLKDTQAAK